MYIYNFEAVKHSQLNDEWGVRIVREDGSIFKPETFVLMGVDELTANTYANFLNCGVHNITQFYKKHLRGGFDRVEIIIPYQLLIKKEEE